MHYGNTSYSISLLYHSCKMMYSLYPYDLLLIPLFDYEGKAGFTPTCSRGWDNRALTPLLISTADRFSIALINYLARETTLSSI